MPRQIIIEIDDGGKEVVLRKDETASVFERSAILGAIIQTPNIPVIPQSQGKDLSINKNENANINTNGTRGESKPSEKNPSRKSGKQ